MAVEGKLVLVDVPLLYEAGWQAVFDYCVVVYADCCTCCQRIMKRDQIDRAEAERTIQSQMSLAEKILHADHVVDNSGSMVATLIQVSHLGRYVLNVTKDL